MKERFMEAFDNFKNLIIWQLNLNVFSNAYEFLPFILPAIVVAPGIFAGELEVGKVSEAQGAFIRIFFSLNLIVARFQELTSFGAGIDRLYTFAESLEQPNQNVTEESTESDAEEQEPIKPTFTVEEGEGLSLAELTLMTPNYQRTLITDLYSLIRGRRVISQRAKWMRQEFLTASDGRVMELRPRHYPSSSTWGYPLPTSTTLYDCGQSPGSDDLSQYGN